MTIKLVFAAALLNTQHSE